MTTSDENTSEERAYRFGIIGFGWLGGVIGEQIRDHERATVAGVADISAEARAEASEELALPSESVYEEYTDLIASEEMDGVVIATPHAFHYEQLTAALDAELDILCEKPLCIDPAKAKAVVDRVEASERTVMVGYQRHLSSAYRAARDHVDGRKITHVDIEITQPYMDLFGGTWRTDPDLSGGGVIMDTGNHLLDGMLWTTGLTPVAVSAEMSFTDEEERVDEAGALNVEFAEDVVASVSVSGLTHRFSEHLHVYTDEDAVYFDEFSLTTVDTEGERTHSTFDSETKPSKIEALIEAIEDDVEPPATARDSFRSVALTEAAYESARTGERVPVDLDPS